MIKGRVLKSPVGKIIVLEDEVGIYKIDINNNFNEKDLEVSDSKNIELALKELKEYFQGERRIFTFKLSIKGTEFQKKVWKELINIPYGETRSYKEIAEALGNEKASRAVGNANNKNNLPIVIPCHRIIGKNGNMIGYSLGLEVKKILLKLEKDNLNK